MTHSKLFLAFIALISILSISSAEMEECLHQITSNGAFQGKWVNLNLLANANGYTVKDDHGWDDTINFCAPVPKTCPGKGAAMGIQTYSDGQCQTLSAPMDSVGSQIVIKDQPSSSNDDATSPDIIFHVNGGDDGRSFQVTCHCKEGQKAPTVQWTNQDPQKQYNMRAFSEYCCASDDYGPGGHPPLFPVGILGLFLIIGLFLFALYWPIGAVINKFIRKKEGLEIIPNIAFWKALPFLFWAGFSWLPQTIIAFIQSKRGGGAGAYEEA